MRTPVAALLPLAAAVAIATGACSRASTVLEDPAAPPPTFSGVPAAASSAHLAPSAPSMVAPTGVPSGGLWAAPVLPPPPPLPGPVLAPRIRQAGVTTSSKALPVEVIERVVRQNFGRFRFCYESGLHLDPGLAGTIRTRFVIEADGSAGAVSEAGSDLPDTGVVACVQRGFGVLSFPAPEGGAMTVTYSLSFAPGSP